MKVKNLALATIFTALYATLVVTLVGISFQLIQVRVADALIPLSIVFGWPAVIGVTVGCAISNMVSPSPSVFVDITLGASANLIASVVAWRIGSIKEPGAVTRFLGCLSAALIITFIVGTYLAAITGMEVWVWWLGIGIGSLISMVGVGYPLLEILKRVKLA